MALAPLDLLAGGNTLAPACGRELGDEGRLLELCDRAQNLAHEDRSRCILDEVRGRRRRDEGDSLRSTEAQRVTGCKLGEGDASTAAAAAAIPSVILCVADGIVRIAAGIIRAAVRLSGGINLPIGVCSR
jgi:hypothetical protein